jgi:hypothetical protein
MTKGLARASGFDFVFALVVDLAFQLPTYQLTHLPNPLIRVLSR